jgi:hypothetical protein
MALTLVEAAKIAMGRDETLKATIMDLYARSSDFLQYMPWETITGNALSFNREKTLPNAGFRGLNEAYTEGTGELERITESLAIAGGDLDVDVMLVNTTGVDQRSVQESMKIKALSLAMTKEFIKGDVVSTPKSFDGLQTRCTGDQLIAAGSTTCSLSLTKLDELIDAVEDPTHLVMNKTMRRRLSAAARLPTVGGYITYDLDSFGRRITKYNDLPILLIDKDNTNTDILPFTETGAASVADSTSIYCVSFDDTGVVGLQSGEMDVRDLGEIDTKPVLRTRVEWYVTLAILRPKAAARLWSIDDIAVSA